MHPCLSPLSASRPCTASAERIGATPPLASLVAALASPPPAPSQRIISAPLHSQQALDIVERFPNLVEGTALLSGLPLPVAQDEWLRILSLPLGRGKPVLP